MAEIEYVELGSICEVVRGGSPRPIIDYITEDNDGVNWLKIGDVSETDKYFTHANEKIKPSGISKTRPVVAGDLILSNSMSFGRAFITLIDGCIHDGWLRLRCDKSKIDKEYLYYFLTSSIAQNQFKAVATGSVVNNLKSDTVKATQIALPPLYEQKKIATVLSLIDEKIVNNNAINRNLLDQAIAIFADKIWSEDKNGTIGDYCTMKSGFAFKSSWWTDKGIKVIKIGDINQDNLNLSSCSCVDEDKFEKAGDFAVVSGDLVLAMTGATIGKFAMIPERKETILVNQRVGKFFLGNDPLKRVPFIYCTLKMDEVYSEVIGRGQGSAQSNISAGDVMSIPCVIPSQEAINEFNTIAGPMFTSIVKNQNENEQLANLRDTLLPKIMSGELDVSELDI